MCSFSWGATSWHDEWLHCSQENLGKLLQKNFCSFNVLKIAMAEVVSQYRLFRVCLNTFMFFFFFATFVDCVLRVIHFCSGVPECVKTCKRGHSVPYICIHILYIIRTHDAYHIFLRYVYIYIICMYIYVYEIDKCIYI